MITADQVRKITPYTVPELLVMIEKKIVQARCMMKTQIKLETEFEHQEVYDELIRCGFRAKLISPMFEPRYYIISW